MPVGLAKSGTGEYTCAIFPVATIALLVSWFVAVVFTPYLGFKLLPDYAAQRGASRRRAEPSIDTPFYRRFRALVRLVRAHRWTVIGATVRAFALSRLRLPLRAAAVLPDRDPAGADRRPAAAEGASLRPPRRRCEARADLLTEAAIRTIENFVSYVGSGSPRFFLPLDQQLFNPNFAQFVVDHDGHEERERCARACWRCSTDGLPRACAARVSRLENGPPVGFPVQFRVIGRRTWPAARHRRRGGRRDARQPADARRAPRLERAEQGGPARDRPGQGARARRHRRRSWRRRAARSSPGAPITAVSREATS